MYIPKSTLDLKSTLCIIVIRLGVTVRDVYLTLYDIQQVDLWWVICMSPEFESQRWTSNRHCVFLSYIWGLLWATSIELLMTFKRLICGEWFARHHNSVCFQHTDLIPKSTGTFVSWALWAKICIFKNQHYVALSYIWRLSWEAPFLLLITFRRTICGEWSTHHQLFIYV